MRLPWCAVLVIIFYVIPSHAQYEPHSCNLGGAKSPPRTVFYSGSPKTITFQESERLQHKLINAALIILATDKLGYRNLTTVQEPGPLNLNLNEFYKDTAPSKIWPNAVINVEMQVPLGHPLNVRVENLGLSSTSTQYRWWLHSPPGVNGTCALARHLHFYTDPKLIDECYLHKTFLTTSDPVLANYTVNNDYCKSDNCPVVLSTDKSEMHFLEEHVKLLKINFSIIWLGNKLNSLVTELRETKSYSFFIVDSISWNDKSTVVVSVSCEQLKSNVYCPYEKISYSKVVFYLFSHVKKLYSLIMNFNITDQVDSLISEYRSQVQQTDDSHRAIESSACSWLKSQKNTKLIESWFNNKPPEIIVTLLYCENNTSQNILPEVMKTTVNYINDNNAILEGKYKLQMWYRVVDCKKDLEDMVKVFFDSLLSNDNYLKLAGFVMPAVPQIIDIAMGLSRYYGTPVFTFSSEGPTLANRTHYPHVFRTVGEKANLNKAYFKLCSQYEWKRVAAVSGYNQNNADFISLLREYLLTKSDVKFGPEKITEKNSKSSIMTALKKLQNNNARIILVDVNLERIKELLLTAHELGMLPSQGYVWLLPDWAPSLHAELNNLDSNQAHKIKQVLDGHLYLKFSSLSDDPIDDIFVDKFRRILKEKSSISDDDYSNAGYFVDAIWTIALSVKQLIENHAGAEDDIHGTIYTLSNYMKNQNFKGVTGNVEFYEGSIKTSFIEVNQWIKNGDTIKINMIAKIKVHADNDDTDWICKNLPQWRTLNKAVPGDGSASCFFAQDTNDFYTSCNDIPIFGALTAIIIVVTIFIIAAALGLKRHRNKINLLLDVLNNTNTTALINRLHSYEVPRDNIDMQWEIGKGSFGKVYGGYLKMDDDTWSKVAIKILKSDATGENELDFLGEAQTMASFDHKNIVKLMAVCTVGTPILIVMELMLFEDLKKFLITKRHLLHDTDCTRLKCTTPKGLTTMAHDVAMALSYLASKKFVHRDVASRNCMVNSYGVVKLGDFGMARYVFSKGEYLCQRKALFPVRWMAPESLKEGTFTSMSDVWSYGILLYEIITFGSTPYKNIKEVHYVKEFIINGNIIRLSSGVNPQLKWLMEQCWSYDDSRRPTAADIVVYLAEHPTLLHACLDEPLEYRGAGNTTTMADTGETPTVLIDSRGYDTTGSLTLDYTALHERKDSGYEPDESVAWRLNSLTSASKL